MPKIPVLFPLFFLLLSSVWVSSVHAELVIVVHPENSASLSSKDVQRIFLGKEKKFPDGKESLPINQAVDNAVRNDFDTNVLGRSTTQVAAYWSKLVFTGKGIPPKEVDSDATVIEIIANNKNAIGYVDSTSVTGAVKVVPLSDGHGLAVGILIPDYQKRHPLNPRLSGKKL